MEETKAAPAAFAAVRLFDTPVGADKPYTYAIPQITWEAGKRYIYSITMRSNDAEIGGKNGQSVTIEGWTSTEEDITLVPVK